MGRGSPRPLSPIPSHLHRHPRFTVHFCSSSKAVNGHCSVEKDKNVFSLEALFQTFSPWAQGGGWEASPRQGGPRQGGVAIDVGGAAWVGG